MTSRAQRRSGVPGRLELAAALAVAAAFVGVVVAGLIRQRLWEDEAYNLSVPVNLSRGLGYLSAGILNGGIPTLFDVKVSTGPAVLVPIAPLVAWGVDPVVAGRSIGAVYAVLLAWGVYMLGRRISGRGGGIAAVASSVMFTAAASVSPIQGLTDVLGEVAAAAFLILAVLVIRRRPAVAGLLAGFAFESKNLAVLAIPALLVGVLLASADQRRLVFRGGGYLAGAAVPVALFEVTKLISLGPDGYGQNVRELRRFLASGGQSGFATTWWEKLGAAMTAWSLPGWAFGVLVLCLLLAVAFVISRVPSSGRVRTAARVLVPPGAGVEALVVIGIAATWMAWWLLSSQTPLWLRHPAPALLLFGALAAACAVSLVHSLWGASATRPAAIALMAVLAVAGGTGLATRIAEMYSGNETLANQREVAEALAMSAPDDTVHAPWGRSAPIAFLQDRRLVLPGEGTTQDGLWLFAPPDQAIEALGRVLTAADCSSSVVFDDYLACTITGLDSVP